MNKKRLSLSLLALIGSVFLFVIASFAWFAISNIVDIGSNIIDTDDVNVNAILFKSDDNITYDVTSNIDFQNQVPGAIKYYKLVVSNNNNYSIYTQVYLYGFINSYTDINADTSNFSSGNSLMDVILLNSSNSINADLIVNQPLSSIHDLSDMVVTHEYIQIPTLETVEFYFSFTLSPNAGNDYENLRVDVSKIIVTSTR